ncbi:unnamed protein product [Lactuca saligna]|uniref:Pentacotripeptide-repeat region of PRORP domain-containing protein n=1 Tax=Lactuca saligna TaxID=75948 RepID=A0AA35Z804_LACSI|nr:unnamed protein product [Lactuca saligna]
MAQARAIRSMKNKGNRAKGGLSGFLSSPLISLVFISRDAIMWALRRTSSIALRSQTFSAVTFRVSYPEHKTPFSTYVDKTRFTNPSRNTCESQILIKYSSNTHSNATSKHTYSSMASTKSSGEEDDDELEDGFSELEGNNDEDESDNESTSEPELSENDMEESVPEITKTHQQKRASSAIFKALMDSPMQPAQKTLDKWLEKGDSITRSDVSIAMLELRRRRMYAKALQLSEWLQTRKQLEFNEKDYSSHIDLISKVNGLQAAENHISRIPKSFQGELLYRTLLANSVRSTNTSKSEQIFNKMKELKLPITPFVCNQLLLLYKRTNKKKIPDVLKLMEDENVKPSLFTYRMLLDIKGQSNDISGIEQILEVMKAEDINIDADPKIRAILARHYINFGLKEKAKTVLKELEGSDLKENRSACAYLLPLYASLGSLEEVNRIWSICESNPMLNECLYAITAYGTLNKVDQAETVFDQMSNRYKRISARHYAVMLKVYANNKMLSKGKDLVKRMAEIGCQIGPLTWDALVKLYVEAGEIEKADLILRRASEQNRVKPFFNSYMVVMDEYAKKGDVHNAEKMFHRMRQDGYVARLRQYHSLLKTYINAKMPAYGFRERMKADNIFPTKSLAGQLAQVDAFKRTAVSNLLD